MAGRRVSAFIVVMALTSFVAGCSASPTASRQRSGTNPSAIPSNWPLAPGSAVPARALYAVSFPTADSGYAVAGGYEAGNGTLPMQLASTTDGGATWHAIEGLLPDANKPLPVEGSVVPRLAFATYSLGYNWDQAEVDATTDGGAHWNVLPDPPGMRGPYRIGPVTLAGTSLWVAYGATCSGVPCSLGHVASWTQGVGWTERLDQDFSVSAMTATASHVYLIATVPGQPLNFSMFQSSVGGTSSFEGRPIIEISGWQRAPRSLVCASDTAFVDTMAASDTAVLVECIGQGEAGWTAHNYWLTSDGGATWTMQARDSAQASLKAGVPPVGESGSMAQGAGRFWVAVTRSTLFASRDQGITWVPARGITTQGAGDGGSVTFNGTNGWCLYHGIGLWRTGDGGSTWKELGESGL